MGYPENVRAILWGEISGMSETPWRFAKRPGADFTRARKLGLEGLLRFLVTMGSGTIGHELLKRSGYGAGTMTASAFCQQRAKLSPEAMPHLLLRFNTHFPLALYRDRYSLIACDGCEYNIARNPDDPDTFHPPGGKSKRGFNMLHTVSLFDLGGKRYLDCVVQPGRKKNEYRAICELIDRWAYGGEPIFIADRGFASYNLFAHAEEARALFLVRAKDVNAMRLLGAGELPDSIDERADVILTRSQSKKMRAHPELAERYRYIDPNVQFDYIKPGSPGEYPLSLRVVRFEVADGSFENVVTNLPADGFPAEEIKRLYDLRWRIETSFRDLKHTIGATNFHSKTREYIEMEIWARLTLFNFCAVVTAHVVISQGDTKHIYKVNFSMAMKTCHHFIRLRDDKPPPDVEGLIGSYILPVRPGRNYARQHRFQLPASFCYRLS